MRVNGKFSKTIQKWMPLQYGVDGKSSVRNNVKYAPILKFT